MKTIFIHRFSIYYFGTNIDINIEKSWKGWSRKIPEPVFSILLTFHLCILLNRNPFLKHKRIIRLLRYIFSINH